MTLSIATGALGIVPKRQPKQRLQPRKVPVLAASALPSELVIATASEVWKLAWRTMMEQLAPSKGGAYQRPQAQFRYRPIVPNQSGRYRLYASPVCPWAHRTLILYSLKGLEEAIPLSIALPSRSGLWELDPAAAPPGCKRLIDVYRNSSSGFRGRATVPMLWDSVTKEVVNNESADIIHVLNSDFNQVARNPDLDLAPNHLSEQINHWNRLVYANINDGVYKCGFAQSQSAYDRAVVSLFSTLRLLDDHLSTSRFLCGDCLTLSDVRLFTTLFRFDAVYHILFKCSTQKLSEFTNLYGYLRDIYQIPGVSTTCNLQAIMDAYYQSLFPLNPGAIQPPIPNNMKPDALLESHGRLRHKF